MKAKKSLGQNFLVSDIIINKIVSLLDINENDLIIEIGPGKGALTEKLVKLPSKLVCIEIDYDMHKYLDRYTSCKCDIYYQDILKTDINQLLSTYQYENLFIIGNLPYYITTPIIEKLLLQDINAKKLIFMVQKEVANRFTALNNSKDFGYMTLFIDYFYDAKHEFMVNRINFNPVPKVDSAVITLDNYKKRNLIDESEYFQFVKKCFSQKRKTLKNNLDNVEYLKIVNILNKYGFDNNVRAEQLNQDIFIEMFNEIYK